MKSKFIALIPAIIIGTSKFWLNIHQADWRKELIMYFKCWGTIYTVEKLVSRIFTVKRWYNKNIAT